MRKFTIYGEKMTSNLRDFTAAVYAFDAVVQRIPADGWGAASACEGWSARDLLQHQCAVLNGVAQIARTGAMAKPTPPEDVSDPTAAWNQCRQELLEALDQQDSLSQAGPFWFDAATVDDLIGIVQWDPLAHSWDLAQAHGLAAPLPEAATTASLARIKTMQPMLTETGRTAEPVACSPDASIGDRFLSATGRNPAS